MAREIAQELQRFEGLAGDFNRLEVLAWRTEERPSAVPPLPPDRLDVALLWGRIAASPPRWIVVQVFHRPHVEDGRWRRSLIWRELRSPLTHPRPGEDRDGTWHGYAQYDHAPSSREICDFAAVSFLDLDDRGSYRTAAGGFRIRIWVSVTGTEPACPIGADIPH